MGYESKNISRIDTEYLFQIEAPKKETIRNFWDSEVNRPSDEVGEGIFLTQDKSILAGYPASDFRSVDDIYSLIHPDDVDKVVNFSVRGLEFINNNMGKPLTYKSQIVFSIRAKGGNYKTFLRKCFINGVNGCKATRNEGYLKDISWMSGVKSGSWKLDGEGTEFVDFKFTKAGKFSKILTTREIVILRLLARNFHSRDITEALKIFHHTGDMHKKNTLNKAEATSTA